MSKTRVNERQTRIIKHHQEKKRLTSATDQKGLLIAQYGKQLTILSTTGEEYFCHLRQHLGNLVPGDKVIWEKTGDNEGIILAVEPRHNELTRVNRYGEKKTVAANLDQVIIVLAPEPEPQWELLDSYLVAIENEGYETLILLNKADLISKDNPLFSILKNYQNIGYATLITSTHEPETLAALQKKLDNKANLFVGQSGVGKSSLLKELLNDPSIAVGALKEASRLGAHTTSTTKLFPLSTGGWVIDSPGIREFGIQDYTAESIASGFIEFRPYFSQCRFRNCSHQNEPHCAIINAVEKGEINRSRWENYLDLLNNIQ